MYMYIYIYIYVYIYIYIKTKKATIENLVDKTWLCRYPRPTIITHDRMNELLGHAFKNIYLENK